MLDEVSDLILILFPVNIKLKDKDSVENSHLKFVFYHYLIKAKMKN